jgi:hypothetical protein
MERCWSRWREVGMIMKRARERTEKGVAKLLATSE